MSPDQYIEQLERLVAEGKDREALDFAARGEPAVRPPLSIEQIDHVGGMLEMVAMAVAMAEATTMPEIARTT